MVKTAEQDDSAVNQSQQVKEGPEKTKEQEEREKHKHSQGQAKSDTRGSGSEEEKQTFEDPDLGHHVDLVG